ncbi:MAG: transposase, partial [Bacteroidetes bacterium]|nr:transposase [Bacteroidota bacterium]
MLKCNHCGNACVEAGFQKTKVQPYKCKGCNKYCQLNYSYLSYTISDKKICRLVKESCGIHSIARIAEISPSTVLRRIRKIASTLFPPKLYT